MATSGDREPKLWCAEVTWLVTVRGPSHSNKNKPHVVGTSPAESRETPISTTALALAFVSPRTPKTSAPAAQGPFASPTYRFIPTQKPCAPNRTAGGRFKADGKEPPKKLPRQGHLSVDHEVPAGRSSSPCPSIRSTHAVRITGVGLQPRGRSTSVWLPICTAAPRGVSKPCASPRQRQPLGEASQLHRRHGKLLLSGISSALRRDGELVGSTL